MSNKIDISKIPKDEIKVLLLAIIEQAIDDYTNAFVKGRTAYVINDIRYDTVKEIREFFYSDYFNLLSSGLEIFDEIDSDDIMIMLDKRVQHYMWKKKKKCSKCRNYKCKMKVRNSYGNKEICPNEICSNG